MVNVEVLRLAIKVSLIFPAVSPTCHSVRVILYDNTPWNHMVYNGITWYYMSLHAVPQHTMVYYDITWCTVVDHALSNIVYGNCMVQAYRCLPVSKHHGI